MANIIITNGTGSIFLNFGDLQEKYLIKERELHKSEIHLDLGKNDEIVLDYDGKSEFILSFDGQNGHQVDLVDGVAPTSNSDLRSKLMTLKNS